MDRPAHCPAFRRLPAGLEVCGRKWACQRYYLAPRADVVAIVPRFSGAHCEDFMGWQDHREKREV